MIDYEKLKLAFLYTEKNGIDVNFAYHKDDTWIHWVCMEQFIFDMQEPTKPEPKYKVGDILFWIGYNDDIRENKVESISIRKDIYVYHFSEPDFGAAWEYELFPSHQSLIEHQIAYWQKMSCENYHHEFMDDATGYKSICIHCDKNEFQSNIKNNQPQVDEDNCHKCNVSLASNGQCGNLDCVDESQHESNGHLQASAKQGRLEYKCIKCGEFYR